MAGVRSVRERRTFRFRSRPEAVTAARRAFDGFEWCLDPGAFYDASLCVSELVTNAVLHTAAGADEQLRLDVELSGTQLRVTVTDGGHGFDVGQRDPEADGGWGLLIVERLADRWGVRRDDGTSVWFEIGAEARVPRTAARAVGRASPRRLLRARRPITTGRTL